ncbi:MAG: hypothetical protein KAU24_01780, partial [Candidatus Aenigmarchaeota archaeon]|nr:hypothetical protein [Candidatus Aenigmarchaeota archaeon]
MERFVKLILLLIPVFLLSFFLLNSVLAIVIATPPGALVWEECPDRAVKIDQYNTEIPDNWLYLICNENDGNVARIGKSYSLATDWYDAPNGDIDIESIELIVKMRGCRQCTMCYEIDTQVEIWVWSEIYYEPGGTYWKKLETVTVKEDENYIFDATDWITPNESGAYKVKIKNIGFQDQDRCLWVDYVGLGVTYYVVGEARIWNSLYIDPHSIPKYSSFNAIGEIKCIGGDCGEVNAYLKYSYSEYGEYQNIPSSGIPMYTLNSNPYSCGNMKHLDTCNPYWVVTGTKWSNQGYHIKMVSGSDSVYNETDPIQVFINPGILGLSGSIYSNEINLGDDVKVEGIVTCGTAPCGNVEILAKYRRTGSEDFEVIGESGNLSTTNYNPQGCDQIEPGESCTKSWYVRGNEPGYYQIRLVAYSDDEDVENKTYDLNLRVNPEQTVGVLSVTNVGVSPNEINVSEGATLSGTVSCSQEYCGDVSVYARSGGQKITSNGLGISGDNPKLCSGMQNGGSCDVSWDIIGNEVGMYYLDILADSDQEGVISVTSTVVSLDVSNPVGSLFFPFEPEFGPETIDVSGVANLNAIVECDSGYCGKVTALVKYDNTNLSSSGDLKTNDQNPQTCEAYPCDFFWDINGSKSGGYTITLLVTSNESDDSLSRSYSLTVLDPEKPSLSVRLDSLQDQYELGKTFALRSEVSCYDGDCGEVNVYAKYKENEGDPWSHLTRTTPLSTPENPKTINLNSGESQWVEWTVNSSTLGNYILGINADAIDPNAIDSGTTSKGIGIFRGANIGIDIQSPVRGKTLARGDEFLVKVKVTDSDYPLLGGFVTASSEGFFPPVQLNESGDGIYSETISIG